MKLLSISFLLLSLVLPTAAPAQAPSATPPAETKAQFETRTTWWRDARFGMFIHWDMSSVAGTEISWSRKGSKPLDITGNGAGYVEDPVYDHLYQRFDPEKFDAAKWVQIAQSAGMKYIVFTAKHHGGFCMWNTKLTDYNIMHTPFHRDVVKELADACHKAAMPFGIYYSQRDWHNPDYGIGDNQKYVDYMNGQLRELLTNYGKIDILWFDSYGHGDLVDFWKIGSTWSLIKSLQPGILVNNRLAMLGRYGAQPVPYRGDFDTPEQKLGAFQNTRPWESCITLSAASTWSYRPNDTARSFETCIHSIASCATGDGNILLDVGPSPEGEIFDSEVSRLAEIGDWMKTCGSSIYGTSGGPYSNSGKWGGSTCKGNTIYLHIFHWPGDSLELPPLKAKVLKIGNLSNPSAVPTFQQDEKSLVIQLPKDQQDKVDTVITLELSAPARDEMNSGHPIAVGNTSLTPSSKDSLVLTADQATIGAKPAQLQNLAGISNIGNWKTTTSTLSWNATLPKAGTYLVKLTYSCDPNFQGAHYTLKARDQSLTGVVAATAGWNDFQTVPVGELTIANAGPLTLTITPTSIPHHAVMNLEQLELDPK